MYKVLLSAARPEALAKLAAGIEARRPGPALLGPRRSRRVLRLTQELAPQLVIIDGQGRDKEALALVSKLLMVNAMANTAMVTRHGRRRVP